ncbi:PIN domain-containing protein [Nostoc sp. TCL26-01]|uniref:PIN domain-containing protein n=1 Tax=Nostoc sp. TCL26-01 TaxID=2576904 RepID=UPI0015BCE7C1|nr:PIN domain-containing protein [Nostoc sp. TCL26-01]QLE58119.1 type II toxin-antitoxin system VapC family toxin [Nostoc sp. TCL26-01]
MKKVLLDTDILSESLKRRDQRVVANAIAYLAVHGRYTISMITVLEIVKGWHKLQREDKIQQFFAQIAVAEILTLQLSDAELAGRIYADLERIGQPIGLADSIIAAIAIQQNLSLVSGNLAHYQRIQTLGYSLQLDNWRT